MSEARILVVDDEKKYSIDGCTMFGTARLYR